MGFNLSDMYTSNNDDESELLISNPKVNSVVAAQYSKDSGWYRAKILKVYEKSLHLNLIIKFSRVF